MPGPYQQRVTVTRAVTAKSGDRHVMRRGLTRRDEGASRDAEGMVYYSQPKVSRRANGCDKGTQSRGEGSGFRARRDSGSRSTEIPDPAGNGEAHRERTPQPEGRHVAAPILCKPGATGFAAAARVAVRPHGGTGGEAAAGPLGQPFRHLPRLVS